MRTHSLLAKLLTYSAACVALLYSLTMPWYGANGGGAVPTNGAGLRELDGGFFKAVGRWATDPEGTTGSAALHSWATVLTVLAALGFLAALLSVLPSAEQLGRTALNLVAWAVILVVAYKLIDQPGANADVETRHGALLALLAGLVMLSASSGAVQTKTRKTHPAPMSALHTPGLVDGRQASSAGPPGR
jgi:hypothetical protein